MADFRVAADPSTAARRTGFGRASPDRALEVV